MSLIADDGLGAPLSHVSGTCDQVEGLLIVFGFSFFPCGVISPVKPFRFRSFCVFSIKELLSPNC